MDQRLSTRTFTVKDQFNQGQLGSKQFKMIPGHSLDWQLGDGREIDQILVSHDKEKPCYYTFYFNIISK